MRDHIVKMIESLRCEARRLEGENYHREAEILRDAANRLEVELAKEDA